MFDAIVALYRDLTGDYDTDIRPKTKIKDGLKLSSLGKVQLICEIEERFDIEISAEDLRSFKTIQHIVDYLEKSVS
jgi:acyl carrier protein